MFDLKKARERRNALYAKAEKILKTAQLEKRGLTGEETQEKERIFDEMEKLDHQIDDHERLAEFAARRAADEESETRSRDNDNETPEARRSGGADQGARRREQEARTQERRSRLGLETDDPIADGRHRKPEAREGVVELSNEQQRDAVNAVLRGGYGSLDNETRSIYDQMLERRAMASSDGTGVLVPDRTNDELIKVLRNFQSLRAAGARIISTTNGNTIPIPVMDDTANEAGTTAENAEITGRGDPDVTKKTLGASKYDSGIIKVPRELIQDTTFDVIGFLEESMLERIAVKRNTDDTTTLLAAAGTGKTTAVAGTLTYTEWLDFEHSLTPRYRVGASLSVSDGLVRLVRGLLDDNGRPLWSGGLNSETPDRIGNFRYTLNSDLATPGSAAVSAVLGQFSKFWIRDVGSAVIEVLRERYAEFYQVGYVGIQRGDSVVTDANAFKKLAFAA